MFARPPRASSGADFRLILKSSCIWLPALKTLIALACCLFAWSQVAFGQAAAAAAVPPATVGHELSLWLTRWLVYLLLFALGGACLFRIRWRRTAPRWVRTVAALILVVLISGAAIMLGGPGALVLPRWASGPALALHVVAAVAWVGFLLPAYRTIHSNIGSAVPGRSSSVPGIRRADDTARRLRQSTAWSGLAIILVLASGLGLTLLQMRHPGDLLHTDYGNVLLAKLVLVAVLLIMAMRARWVLAGRAMEGTIRARSRLRRSMGTQIILAAGILSVVSLWRLAPPTHDMARIEEPHGPTVSLENRQARALVELPAKAAGPWRIQVISIDGVALDPQRVVLTLSNPAAGLDPVDHDTVRQPDGRWRVDLLALPAGGQWRVQVRAFISDFDVVTLQRDLDLPENLAPQSPAGANGPAVPGTGSEHAAAMPPPVVPH